jgi:formylglycine-generating enzyme required for sulfatase activity
VKAYADWLVRKTGKLYRLPSEAEWEYAARAGTTTTYPWGEAPDRMCEFARFADLSSPYLFRGICVSGRAEPGAAPVGSLKPNAWGLHDMLGNAWEWVEDCWQPHYRSHPSDGAALAQAECDRGVVRGGGWHTPSWSVRPARRAKNDPAWRVDQAGFRIALTIEP